MSAPVMGVEDSYIRLIKYEKRIPSHCKKIGGNSSRITLDGFVLIWTEKGPKLVTRLKVDSRP